MENFSMEWNMEENFSMEWNMELEIFGMEWKWKKIACIEYGKIVFHSIPCPARAPCLSKLILVFITVACENAKKLKSKQ